MDTKGTGVRPANTDGEGVGCLCIEQEWGIGRMSPKDPTTLVLPPARGLNSFLNVKAWESGNAKEKGKSTV